MRLVTRPDLDGLTCAVLLSHCEAVDSYELVHPQQVRDREVVIGENDILVNVPYQPACGMWFDNHLLTDSQSTPPQDYRGRYGQAPSAARLVYEHYAPTHPELNAYEELIRETDRLDSAQLELEDVLSPDGYTLLGFTLDSKSGLGDPREYFLELVPAIATKPIEEVMELPSVRERAARLREQDSQFREAALAHSQLDGPLIITDFRSLDPLPVGNRFLIYTVFPDATLSLRIQRGRAPDTVSVSGGRSIFNRTSRANIGIVMSLYGGGGQPGAGACVLPAATADAQIAEIVAALKRHA
ncbi:MAG: exopolyphosphatase [Acidobacteria bacterium]|jgi:hypothetical protein|nr:exopolyphosphatase [Acidobacteriota bacterium]